MSSSQRAAQALFLAAAAAHGLVVAGLAHAEEHHREDASDAAEAWRAAGDPLDALAFALTHAHDRPSRPAQRKHSHGPGRHGSGSLSHLAVALHIAPQLPQLERSAPQHRPPIASVAPRRAALRYLIVEQAQGPPRGC
jgi:hypothetical protein